MNEGMDRREFLRSVGAAAVGASIAGAALLKPEPARATARKRTVEEFLSSIGLTVVWVPPIRDFWGWFNGVQFATRVGASVDYCGFAGAYLKANGVDIGTTVDGLVTERPLADGRALVHVELHTINALTWIIPFDPNSAENQFGKNPLLFGYRAAPTGWEPAGEPDVLNGASPALAESHFLFEFTNSGMGDPFPDVNDWSIWGDVYQQVKSSIRANAVGPLRALWGVPDGTPGRCVVSQTGLLKPSPAAKKWDAFPAEMIDLKVTGR